MIHHAVDPFIPTCHKTSFPFCNPETKDEILPSFSIHLCFKFLKSHDIMILMCLESKESKTTIQDFHKEICGLQLSSLTSPKKLLGMVYYWLIMEKGAC